MIDLNTTEFLHADTKFSREFCMGSQIPCSVGDAKNTEGVPKSLGDLTWGCQILGGSGSPMTPANSLLKFSLTRQLGAVIIEVSTVHAKAED